MKYVQLFACQLYINFLNIKVVLKKGNTKLATLNSLKPNGENCSITASQD